MWFQLAGERLDDDCHKENAVLHLGLAAMRMTEAEQEIARGLAAVWKAKPEAPPTVAILSR
jgi:hypothetical protein